MKTQSVKPAPTKSASPKGTRMAIKNWLGQIPYTAEAYWLLRQRDKPLSRNFDLHRLQRNLPEMKQQVLDSKSKLPDRLQPGKNILIFATLRYWIEHAVVMGLGLSGLGHNVTLAYLPYAKWQKPINRFDQRRQSLYTQNVISKVSPLMQTVSFYRDDIVESNLNKIPPELAASLKTVTLKDVQYTLQVEEVDPHSELYQFRLNRNIIAARNALDWVEKASIDHSEPQLILTPNGSILEMGAIYSVARFLNIPVVTYEFGEQRDRIWLAYNSEVMLQETDDMWAVYNDKSLSDEQWATIRALYEARQGASTWANFSRTWQGQPQQGGENVRRIMELDERPIVLLAANVIGDSLTLGRQIFSESMTEWLEKTVRYFIQHPEFQLVVRIHPGEKFTKGPSVANVVRRVTPQLPEHIHIVEANDPTNTYDISEIADLGLVYTTTTGMEMAMQGLPVIVSGKTHYRSKGFTLDPKTWDEYFCQIEEVLEFAGSNWRLDSVKIDLAWQYSYRFFFTYPLPFPWHMVHLWKDYAQNPIGEVLSPEGQEKYSEAFQCLAGKHRNWKESEPEPDSRLETRETMVGK